MAIFSCLLMWVVALLRFAWGGPVVPLHQISKGPCGDWTFYSEDKCIKIMQSAGFQMQREAELLCQTSEDDTRQEALPQLLTIKSEKELAFAQKFLFEEHNIADDIWLGLKSSDYGNFSWNDGSELVFSNWAEQKESGNDRHCVQMESGHGATATEGQWVMVTCRKNNIVVCEKQPTLTLKRLQEKLSKTKSKLEHTINHLLLKLTVAESDIVYLKHDREESVRNITVLNKKHEATQDEIESIKRKTEGSAKGIGNLYLKNQEALQEIRVISLEKETSNSEVLSLKNSNAGLENLINLMEQRNNVSELELKNMKQEVERKGAILTYIEKEIKELKLGNEAFHKEIAVAKQLANKAEEQVTKTAQNPVPVGYIYIQLPNQKTPSELWEGTKWDDVSEKYDSLFFRVVGKNAAAFGKIQEQNTIHLVQVRQKYMNHDDKAPYIPLDGSWSNDVVSGRDRGGPYIGLQFRLNTGEVRPQNEAVRIWQRVE